MTRAKRHAKLRTLVLYVAVTLVVGVSPEAHAVGNHCEDGLDNDSDGLTDFPADRGCLSPTDNDEVDPIFPECADGLDNDADGLGDFPHDPQCTSTSDASESDLVGQCNDGIDNDGDGLIDFPGDTNCTTAATGREVHLRACQDGLDNDADGLSDFPNDPGCHSAFDGDEFDSGWSTTDVRSRLLLAVDTSGSLNMNVCSDTFTGGDGSAECSGSAVGCATCNNSSCGNTAADDSRLYQMTAGLSSGVASSQSIEFALMRFHQRPTGFQCPTAAAGLQSGGWQGGGSTSCGGGFAAGDLLVSFAQNNESTILGWMDHQSNYVGVPPVGTDWELRGSGATPLAGVLNSANSYLSAARAADPHQGCRPYGVILITDGVETCGGATLAAADALLASGISTHVIAFATSAPDVATLNTLAQHGGTSAAIVVNDHVSLSTAIANIVASWAMVELCNGLDDDCDGLSDEGFADLTNACDNGQQGECLRTGKRVCAVDGMSTVCDAPAPDPGSETCNGVDDDCDGLVDEEFPGVGDQCTVPGSEEPGDEGECAFGHLACASGAVTCEGYVGPAAEIPCNGLDEDCDGLDSQTCPSGTQCLDGRCQDCFAVGCAAGEICIRNDATQMGECKPDLCAGVTCGTGETCEAGECVGTGCTPSCGDGETCRGGVCEKRAQPGDVQPGAQGCGGCAAGGTTSSILVLVGLTLVSLLRTRARAKLRR